MISKEKKIKVVNINGWGRSGSTILGNVLGQHDGSFFAGELRNIWNVCLINNMLCSCGVNFKDCEIWRQIFKIGFGDMKNINVHEITRLIKSTTRSRHMPLKFIPGSEHFFISKLNTYLEHIKRIFFSIQYLSRCKIIVDTSKSPLYGYLLSLIDELDVYIVHLVRDPRAVSYSRSKIVQRPHTDIYMHRFNTIESALIWDIKNAITEIYWKNQKEKYLMVRYEDFASRPKYTIDKILDFVHEHGRSPFISENIVNLNVNHSVWGNPTRFKTGVISLKTDDEWKSKMKTIDKFLATSLTFPLLLHYKYSIN